MPQDFERKARRARAALAAVTLACAAPTWGCGEAPPPPPSPVIVVAPAEIRDGERTELAFDAGRSTPRLTLVPVPRSEEDGELSYRWGFSGGVAEIDGDLSAIAVRVVATGDRPVHARLRVRNRWGGEVTALVTVPLVLEAP